MRKTLALIIAGAGIAAGSAAGPASAAVSGPEVTGFTAQAQSAGLTTSQASELQTKVDGVLAKHPGSTQVSANKVAAKGVNIIVAVPGESAARDLALPKATSNAMAPIGCAYGNLCVTVVGYQYNFYLCGNYPLDGWYGNGVFVNNQSRGTVAIFHNQGGGVLWSSVAYQEGTLTWDPVWSITPC